MGTLTAGQPRLPGYCDHKLPASCRLTSIPQCCACADERAHSASYSTYIDGIGFVPRGTRWQRYCWFCREFWENRVKVSGLRPAQTKIPEVPDQSEFLDRWYEFHRGYRIVQGDGGGEERVAVLGEDFRNVDPGCLPRTLEELRAGRAASEAATQVVQPQQEAPAESGPSLDETLDELFQSAAAEEQSTNDRDQQNTATQALDRANSISANARTLPQEPAGQQRNIHAQVMVPTSSRNREYQVRRVAALRRELQRMRNGIERVISGLRDLGEEVPDHAEAADRLTRLGQTLDNINGTPSREEADLAIRSVNVLTSSGGTSQTDRAMANIQARVDEARRHLDEARGNRDQAASELDVAEADFRTSQQRLQQLQREQRTTENYLRLFGTREEMLAQGDQYESPIGGMFTRAYDRFRAAEEVRREERTLRRVLADEQRAGGEEEAQRLAELEARERDVWSVPRPVAPSVTALPPPETEPDDAGQEDEQRGELEEYYTLLRRQNWSQQAPSSTAGAAGIQGSNHLSRSEGSGSATRAEEPSDSTMATQPRRGDNFPRNMLAGVPESQREQAVQAPPQPEVGRELVERLDPSVDLAEAEEWRMYGRYIATYSLEHPEVLDGPDWHYEQEQLFAMSASRPGHALTDEEYVTLEDIVRERHLLWSTAAVNQRLMQRRGNGEDLLIRFGVPSSNSYHLMNIELFVEAFQMSAQLRRRAPGLTAPQQLQMLYRLQAGQRLESDRYILEQMLGDRNTTELAANVHREGTRIEAEAEGSERRQRLRQQLREAAREGDHSRQELDAQRRATRAFAIAAGRTAMSTGPQALMEQMATRDEETQAAIDRLQANGWPPENEREAGGSFLRHSTLRSRNLADYLVDSESETEDSEGEGHRHDAQGLDAKDSGRPEPKTDEEMKLSMECRVCYTQVAEIACLPCGHLVMCKWCSEQHSPVMAHDRTRPRRAAGCPVCRKGIRQKVKIIRG
ncbi:hypothetical protein BAUCODRAFT_383459 [Baudoinia panamericana UAMH 10762]|uniref:RING-type domain-containing protein n=1 Tax=Baudoinia panamericana (strain UAMH 10762) TaxID=717646 RepID=M2LW49_BAUPA|nr:uncharacterized protein BAUCODRAFT_383459 [Baudoinia panamericana UAMH 10762]EMC98887.1 hypothetical protein BAUCODRAFT_383459 [Baudoinia panamericana UAMH 10762]